MTLANTLFSLEYSPSRATAKGAFVTPCRLLYLSCVGRGGYRL